MISRSVRRKLRNYFVWSFLIIFPLVTQIPRNFAGDITVTADTNLEDVSLAKDTDVLYDLDFTEGWDIDTGDRYFTTPNAPVPYSAFVSSAYPSEDFDGADTLEVACASSLSHVSYEKSYIDLGTPQYRLEGLVGVDLSLEVSQLDIGGGCYVGISSTTPFTRGITWDSRGLPVTPLYTSPGVWPLGPVTVEIPSRPRYLIIESIGNPRPNQGYTLSRTVTSAETYGKFFKGLDYMYVQAGPAAETFTLISLPRSPLQLLVNDLITISFATSGSNSLDLALLSGGTVQKTWGIDPSGGRQNLTFTVDAPVFFDQIEFISPLAAGGCLEVSDLVIQRPLAVFAPKGSCALDTPPVGMGLVSSGPNIYAYTGGSAADVKVHFINAAIPLSPFVDDTIGLTGRRSPTAIATMGEYLYVCSDQINLNIVRISNPEFLSTYNLPGGDKCEDIAIEGQYAFVTGRDTGFHALSLSNPESPAYLTGCLTDGTWDLGRVCVSGNYAYCTVGTRGLVIIDVSHPAPPDTVWPESSLLFSGDAATGLAVKGQFAYVLAGTNLHVVDVARSVYPRDILTIPIPGGISTGIMVEGDYAYVFCGPNGIYVVDISDPLVAHFTNAFVSGYSTVASSVCFQGDGMYLYLSDSTSASLQVVEFAAPKIIYENFAPGSYYDFRVPEFRIHAQQLDPASARMTVLGLDYALDRVGSTNEFALQFGTSAWNAWVAAWRGFASGTIDVTIRATDVHGGYIEDVRSIEKGPPTISGALSMTNPISRIDQNNGILYVSDGIVHAFDITIPESPVELCALDSYPANSFALSGNTLGIQNVDTLSLFDISNPATPAFLSSWVWTSPIPGSGNRIHYMAMSGNFAHMMGEIVGHPLDVCVDISDPAHPVQSAYWYSNVYGGTSIDKGFTSGSLAFASEILESGGITYFVNWVDPANPIFLTYVQAAWIDVTFQDNHMFVIAQPLFSAQRYLHIYEVSVGGASQVASYTPVGNPTLNSIAVSGDFVYIGENDGLEVVDVSNPVAPVFAGKIPLGPVSAVLCGGSVAYCGVGNQLVTVNTIIDRTAPVITLDAPMTTESFFGMSTPVLSITLQDEHPAADGVVGIIEVTEGNSRAFRFDRVGMTRQYRLALGCRDWDDWADCWGQLDSLPYAFEIFAGDAYSNVANCSITIVKDPVEPIVEYNQAWPQNYQDGLVYTIGSTPPQVDFTIFDVHRHLDLSSIYAVLCDSSGNYWGSFNCSSYADNLFGFCDDGTATWAAWAATWGNLPSELYMLTLHARDLAGNWNEIAYGSGGPWFRFYKDFSYPTVTVDLPVKDAICESNPPYDVWVGEYPTYLAWVNYSCDGGLHWFTIARDVAPYPSGGPHHFVGTVSDECWNPLPEGPFTFTLAAYDSGGNPRFEQVDLLKETLPPRFENVFPLSGFTSSTPPDFALDVREENGLDAVWYTIDGGIEQHSLPLPAPVFGVYSFSGIIDGGDWANHVDQGVPVRIEFFANDTFAHEDSLVITGFKDTMAPVLEILSPSPMACFSSAPPSITFSLTEFNVDYCTYSNGTWTRTIAAAPNSITTFTVDLPLWGPQTEGIVSITLVVHDKAGYIATASVDVVKDTTPPVLTLLRPTLDYLALGSITWEGAPLYALSEYESNPDKLWVSVDGGIHRAVLTTLTGNLPADFWGTVPLGSVAITFGAADLAGNPVSLTILVEKRDSTPVIAILKPVVGLYSATPPRYEITVNTQGAAIKEMHYSLDGGLSWCKFVSLSGTINATLWKMVANGTVIVEFTVKSVYGRTGYASRAIAVDNLGPIISIISPAAMDAVAALAPLYIITVEDAHLQVVYYSLDGGLSKIPIALGTPVEGKFELTGTIDQTFWDKAKLPRVGIQFYALDTLGNLAMQEVIVDRLDYKPRGDSLDFSLFFDMPWPIAVYCVAVVVVVFGLGFAIRRNKGRAPPKEGK